MLANNSYGGSIDRWKENEQNFRFLAANASDGILIGGKDGCHVFANEAAAGITGYTVSELLQMRFTDLLHPDEIPAIRDRYRKPLLGQPLPNHYETRILTKDGESVFIGVSAAKTTWHDRPAAMALFRDISRRKREEEQLRLHQILMELELDKRKAQIGKANQKLKQYLKKEIQTRREKEERERRWQHLIEAMNDGFVVEDENTIVTYVNQRLCEMTGYAESELVGKPCRTFIAEPSRGVLKRYHETRRKGVRSNYEAVWIAKVGTRISVLHSVAPLFDEKQNYQGIYMVITDISDLKKTQKALEKREAQLHEANLTLKTMLKRRTEEAAEDKKRMIHNLRVMVIPTLDKLRNTHEAGSQRVLVDHLEKTLTDLLSPFARTLSSALYNLSPTEIRIANLIRQEHPNKDIAQLLGLSIRTVEVHRTHIRKKLKLTGKKINLRSYLSTLQP